MLASLWPMAWEEGRGPGPGTDCARDISGIHKGKGTMPTVLLPSTWNVTRAVGPAHAQVLALLPLKRRRTRHACT